jgi:hypothetical protein
MNPVQYDEVLLTGNYAQLNDFIENSGQGLVVDWRGEEQGIITVVSRLIKDEKLSCEWVEAEGDLYVTYQGQRHKVGLIWTGNDRYITLRKLNEILAGDYEIRGFRHTLGDDTHCFYVKPCWWWAEMEKRFPRQIARVFAVITPEMDFPDYR